MVRRARSNGPGSSAGIAELYAFVFLEPRKVGNVVASELDPRSAAGVLVITASVFKGSSFGLMVWAKRRMKKIAEELARTVTTRDAAGVGGLAVDSIQRSTPPAMTEAETATEAEGSNPTL